VVKWVQTIVHEPFFPFKSRPSQSYGLYSSAKKTGSPDSVDFATTLLFSHIYLLAYRTVTAVMHIAQPLPEQPTLAILFFAQTATSLWSFSAALTVRSSILPVPNLPQSGK
jgi:hypothetical protein